MSDKTIYLLCQNGEDQGEWYALSWSKSRKALEAEAMRREISDYEAANAEYLARPIESRWRYSAPIHPNRSTYRRHWVSQVTMFEQMGGENV